VTRPPRPAQPPRYRLSGRQAWFANPRTDACGAIRPGAHLAALQARIAGATAPLASAPGSTAAPDSNAGDTGTGQPGPVNTTGTDDEPSTSGPQWNPLGPAGVGLGQADGSPRVSGRVVSIAAHAGGQRAYVGTANGGTWYTDDAGAHWRCLDTYAETAPLTGRALGQADALAVGAITVEWGADASTDVVYVGTGEPSRTMDSFFGIGIRVATGPAAADPLDPTVSPWTLEAPGLVNKAIYRMAADPTRPGVIYAATTLGLWRRAGAGAADPTVWTKVFDPTPPGGCTWFEFLTGSSSQSAPVLVETDVVIAPAAGASPQTIYVAVQDVTTNTSQQVWQSHSGDLNSWTAIAGYSATERTALAVAPSDPTIVYALSRGSEPAPVAAPPAGPAPPPPSVPTNAARLNQGSFQAISDLPTNLAGGVGASQAYYDTVVAVDPCSADVIWMGGSTMQSASGVYNAALFRGQITAGANPGTWTFSFQPANNNAPATDPTWVGGGAHADVHALEFSGPSATATAWLGCDGGIFQAPVIAPPSATGARGVGAGTAVGTWQAMNTGLAITQPNYLAQTSVSDALLLAGTQDNGTEQRLGPAAWKVVSAGDGGGCVIDPAHPRRRFVQYTRFTWYTETDPARYFASTLDYLHSPLPLLQTAWNNENDDSAFYSDAAARSLAVGATALAFGSHRVWYCEDWGQTWALGTPSPAGSWCTLPTASNPYDATDAGGQPAPNGTQDSLHSTVVRVSFVDDNRLLVLTQAFGADHAAPRRPAALYLFTRTGPPWTVAWLSPPDPSQPPPPPPPAGAQNGLPAGEIPVGLVLDDPGGPVTCYVTLGTGQDPQHPQIDHVWWYDGSHWWPCGFDATVADTPVNAVVVDADHAVYVGSDVGVWKGVPNHTATPPTWVWSQFSHGLPEAPVVDLVISASPHLLRAATHGRGIWELNLDETAPVSETYLRAHSADTRRVFPSGGNDPNSSADPPPPAPFDASPDIVITGPANPAAPADLPLFMRPRRRYSDSVRVLQYALRRRQLAASVPTPPTAVVAVDGYFGQKTKDAVLAVQAANPGLSSHGVVNLVDWQAIVTAPYIDALAGADADHLDMALLDRINPINAPPGGPTLASLSSNAEVYVQVNARGWHRRPVGSVHVGLLATPNFDATLAGLPALPADWVAQFQAAITTAPGSWVTGGAPWAWVGAPATLANARPLHPEEPQVVRFEVTFPLPSGASKVPANWTLLTFVDDPLDPLSSAVTSVHDLVLNDRHAGVRSVTLIIP
jgi:hypothetical protein